MLDHSKVTDHQETGGTSDVSHCLSAQQVSHGTLLSQAVTSDLTIQLNTQRIIVAAQSLARLVAELRAAYLVSDHTRLDECVDQQIAEYTRASEEMHRTAVGTGSMLAGKLASFES